jgi:2-haloacid dehalogenase
MQDPRPRAIDAVSRRDAMALAGAGAAVALSPPAVRGARAEAPPRPRLKAIAFDGFAVFDPRPAAALAERLFPGKGLALAAQLRTKIFEYTWLRVAAGRYMDFADCVDAALTFAVASLGLNLIPSQREQLTSADANLSVFDDMPGALRGLKAAGLRLVILANPTPAMLDRAVRNSALEGVFEDVISTDRVKSYKPDPRAYQLAPEPLGGPVKATLATMDELTSILIAR